MAAAASPNKAALSGSLKFLPIEPLSDETIRILLYWLEPTKQAAVWNAVKNDKQVEWIEKDGIPE